MPLITLLIWLVVICFVIWAALAIVRAFGIPDPWRTLILIVVGLVILLLLLSALGGRGLSLPRLT